jgi:oligoribonuclease (3'-5' exoribonuclease)
MQYVALDIETSGLDPDCCQVLQVAAVIDVLPAKRDTLIADLPHFEGIVWHESLHGEPPALAMNVDLFKAMTIYGEPDGDGRKRITYHDREVWLYGDVHTLSHDLLKMIANFSETPPPYVAAGRKVDAFDLAFMPEGFRKYFHHRAIDVSSMALGANPSLWGNAYLPSADKILGSKATHDAYFDAVDVVKAIRAIYREHPEVGE